MRVMAVVLLLALALALALTVWWTAQVVGVVPGGV